MEKAGKEKPAGYTYQQSRTWCPTGTAERVRKEGIVTIHDPQTQEKKPGLAQAYHTGENAGVIVRGLDEAGPYQAIPQPGASWQPEGKAALQPASSMSEVVRQSS